MFRLISYFSLVTDSEKAMAPHSSTLAWKIPWTAEPGRLQSMGLQGVDATERLHFHALEKEMATHSSVPRRIPGTGEPGGLPSMGSHRVGHDWSDLAAAAVHVWRNIFQEIVGSDVGKYDMESTLWLGFLLLKEVWHQDIPLVWKHEEKSLWFIVQPVSHPLGLLEYFPKSGNVWLDLGRMVLRSCWVSMPSRASSRKPLSPSLKGRVQPASRLIPGCACLTQASQPHRARSGIQKEAWLGPRPPNQIAFDIRVYEVPS